MIPILQDFPAFCLLILISAILQTLVIHVGIDLYRNAPVKDTRVSSLALLFLTEALIVVCLWLQTPYRVAVEFPAAGSILRYSQPNERPDRPAVLRLSADGTESSGKLKFVITLREVSSGRPVLQTYLKGGQEASIFVPPGAFSVSVEQGLRWFGAEKSFGPAGAMLPSSGVLTMTPGGEGELRIAEKSRHQ